MFVFYGFWLTAAAYFHTKLNIALPFVICYHEMFMVKALACWNWCEHSARLDDRIEGKLDVILDQLNSGRLHGREGYARALDDQVG